jgi:4-diphosphocytidyl-2-C-methyl-D-erythritol kinase
LYITSRRADGYHNLETIFYPIPLTDALEIIENKNPGAYENPVLFSTSGMEIHNDPADNLCVKAYRLIKKDYPGLPPIQMHLHKVIPLGAGLGGGSSDGAHTPLLLNEKFNLGISTSQLLDYALQLGSDCPFFIINKPTVGRGRGEILDPIEINLKGFYLIMVNPGIHVSTREAFGSIIPRMPVLSIENFASFPVEEWKDKLSNDFEPGVFAVHPILAEIKSSLYEAGASYASMSGSGSSIFGLFSYPPKALPVFPSNYLVRDVML